MKTILIVDDDRAFLDRVVRAFGVYRDQFRVLEAGNGVAAQKVIAEEPVDLLVTDLEMPAMDGYELLAYMLQNHPSVSIIVMSDFGVDSLGEALGDIDSIQCLQKPVAPESLLFRARAAFTRRAKGYLTGISLTGFLQLLHIENKTCGLRVTSGTQTGSLEVLEGEVINAVCAGRKGEEAVYRILSWEQPDIEMMTSVLAAENAIGASLPHLLFEAARQKDETARSKEPFPRARALRPVPEPEPEPAAIRLSDEQLNTMKDSFQEFLALPGVLGVALVDLQTGSCLVTEAGRLTPNFDRLAARVASIVRMRTNLLEDPDSQDRVEGVTVHLSQHVELFHPLQAYPELLLYFVAEREHADLPHALTKIMEIEGLVEALELAAG